MNNKKKSLQFFTKLRVVQIVATFFLLLSIAFFLFALGTYYAKDILNQIVKRESNGYYELSFAKLRFDILERKITLNRLELNLDPLRSLDSLKIRNAYEVQVTELVLDIASLTDFYLNKELEIENVRVVDPGVRMIKLSTRERTEFSFEAGNLYRVLSEYLKVLKINKFTLEDGNLDYKPGDFSLGNIDFFVQNMAVDSASGRSNVFYSESIELEIRNQHFFLPDNIHEISFDKFILSTSDSLLSFHNFNIKPTESSGVAFEGYNDFNVYDVNVPLLQLKGVDYLSAYQGNQFSVKELKMKDAQIFVDDETHVEQRADSLDNSILALLFNVFDLVDIKRFEVENANIDLKLSGEQNYQRIRTSECGVVFHNVLIDTASYRFDKRKKYFDNLEVEIKNYRYLLPDSLHVIKFDFLKVNSFQSSIDFENLAVFPNRYVNPNNRPLIDLQFPDIRFSGVDYLGILDKRLIIDSLEISRPAINLRFESSLQQQQAINLSVKELFQAVKSEFEQIAVSNFRVNSARCNLPGGLSLGNVSLRSRDIALNKDVTEWSDLFRATNVQVTDLLFDRDTIKIEGSLLRSSQNLVNYYLEDWTIDVQEVHQKVNVKFDAFAISKMDFDSLMAGNFLHFEKAVLQKPVVDIQVESQSDKAGKSKINLGIEKELIVLDGEFYINYDSTKLSIRNIDGDIFTGDSTAFRSLSLEDLELTSLVLNQHVKMRRWSYDTLDGQMEFFDVKIEPVDRSTKSEGYLEATLPYVDLIGFQQSEFFDNKHFKAKEVVITRPEI
ncbi:MAG: hypothetical protein AAF789_06595, partial [Bacteroidota bacterium]